MAFNVLLIDDHNLSILQQKKIWKNHFNLEPEIAKSGQEALDKINSKQYNLVITDQVMPGMTGDQLVKKIRQIEGYEKIPIVVLSAESNISTVKTCLMAGANDYIVKPLEEKTYFTKINKLIKIFQ